MSAGGVTLRPWLLAVLLLVAGALGGAAALGLQTLLPDRSDVRGYLLANPEVIPEAIQKLQERESGKLVAANRSAVLNPWPGMVAGNPKGDVTVAIYMDYACGFCRQSLPEIDRLVAADPNLRLVYHELPILSAESRTAAAWALAAAEQGKFLPFHTAMFATGRPSETTIATAAAQAGLDIPRARTTAASPQVAAQIDKNLRTAAALGITGTPAWVIGNRVISGAVGQEQLAEAIKAARATG